MQQKFIFYLFNFVVVIDGGSGRREVLVDGVRWVAGEVDRTPSLV